MRCTHFCRLTNDMETTLWERCEGVGLGSECVAAIRTGKSDKLDTLSLRDVVPACNMLIAPSSS